MAYYGGQEKKVKQAKRKSEQVLFPKHQFIIEGSCSHILGFLPFSLSSFKKKLSHLNAITNNNKTYLESKQFRVKTQINRSIQDLEALKYTCNVNKITSRTPDSLQISSFCSKIQLPKQSVTLLKEFCLEEMRLFCASLSILLRP